MSVSNTLQLNCWFVEDEPSRIFIVRIKGTQAVGDLQELIKSKKSQFRNIDADALIVSKVARKIDLMNDITRPEPRHLQQHEVRRLHAWFPLSEVFNTQPNVNQLHIVVSTIELPAKDEDYGYFD
ncbi:uncharacterized protein EDB91DRAFT_1120598 [Suillus paluster]|uniref:uncharacterized protein n=1 Tax=Suillus paluster TaxID=48578 RepID=UPI001B886116|nr:uncharacterized protein EDB91DRAFT_1120598 [Suillus paluster]KAG1745387.1 hypothetical protein EDB91DRAFT_1120598 [Suillus paluster]